MTRHDTTRHDLRLASQLVDSLWAVLTDQYSSTAMGETAELLADKHNITRQQCDEFAILSQQRWKAGAPHIRRSCAHTRDILNRKNTYYMER